MAKGGTKAQSLKKFQSGPNLSEKDLKLRRISKKATEKAPNPFENFKVKRKHDILGVKQQTVQLSKNKSRDLKLRKEALLTDFYKTRRANTFIDKRIGESNVGMTDEEKMLLRFQKERQRQSMYNLDDDDDFADSKLGDDVSQKWRDEDEDGPFALKKKRKRSLLDTGDGDGDTGADYGDSETLQLREDALPQPEAKRSRREILEGVIEKSKQAKYERSKEKDERLELVDKLDEEWKSIANMMTRRRKEKPEDELLKRLASGGSLSAATASTEGSAKEDEEEDEYDKMVNELLYDTRATPTDRLKTPEELAREESERLEKLEQERLARMRGEHIAVEDDSDSEAGRKKSKASKKQKTAASKKSADDIDDEDFDYETNAAIHSAVKSEHELKTEAEDSDEDADEEEDDEEEGEEEEGEDGSEEDDNENEAEADIEEEDEDNEATDEDTQSLDASILTNETEEESLGSDVDDEDAATDIKEEEREQMSEVKIEKREDLSDETAAKKTVPFVIDAPTDFKAFQSLLRGYDSKQIDTLLQRLTTLHSITLDRKTNTPKMERLYTFLIRHFEHLINNSNSVNSAANGSSDEVMQMVDVISLHIYLLTQQLGNIAANHWTKSVLPAMEKQLKDTNKIGGFPRSSYLLLVKLIDNLFPVSDMQHPITTPAMLWIAQTLSCSPIGSLRDVAAGLFLTSVSLHYVNETKRLVPEALNFLVNILSSALPRNTEPAFVWPSTVPRCHTVGKANENTQWLYTNESSATNDVTESSPPPLLRLLNSDFVNRLSTQSKLVNELNQTKVSLLKTALTLTLKFSTLYCSQPSFAELFQPLLHTLTALNSHIPSSLKSEYKKVVESIEENTRNNLNKREPLRLQTVKVKPLPTFEPMVFSRITGHILERDRVMQQRRIIREKTKREKKTVIREFKRDTALLAKARSDQRNEEEKVRKEKLKDIMKTLESQQHMQSQLDFANRERRRERRQERKERRSNMGRSGGSAAKTAAKSKSKSK